MVKLILRTTRDGKLIYGIGYRFRFVYLFFALAIGIGAYANWQDPSVSLFSFPVVLMVLLIIASLYQEAWICDKSNQQIVYRYGLLFLYKQRVFPFEQIARFELSVFRKGTRGTVTKAKNKSARLYRTFSLVLTDGSRHDLEILRLKQSSGRTEEAASRMAQYCDIPLRKEDTGPQNDPSDPVQ